MNKVEQGRRIHEPEHTRTGLTAESLQQAIIDNLFYIEGRLPEVATTYDQYIAVAYTLRDRLMSRFVSTSRISKKRQARTVCYLSAEFLLGPQLGNNMLSLGITGNMRKACAALDMDLDSIMQQEAEPGLGNGGLGRLAACFMDSLSTLQIPAIGYGIRYEYGIFEQRIENGWQVEHTDAWLRYGYPWELNRLKIRFPVLFGGHVETYRLNGKMRKKWVPDMVVNGVAFDTPILGYGVDHTNMLRLWKAEANKSFNFQVFNQGDYYGAVDCQVAAENLTKILYPNDEPEVGKELRLKQQYFFVSCSLQDMIRIHLAESGKLRNFHQKFTIQLNDTHPTIAIVELMRLLIDQHQIDWEDAWALTRQSFAYTNHTLLPEALEKWPVYLFERLLPRHLEIIYELNSRFLDEVRSYFIGDDARVQRMSLIDESGSRHVRMANLACVGSYAINGVAVLHSELLKTTVLHDFYDLWPEKFSNKTNGVTPRRFLALSNPPLTRLLCDKAGEDWLRDMDRLRPLERLADNEKFQQQWWEAKSRAKSRLADYIRDTTGISVDPDSLFDIQVKRIHEYKRQHLNLLHVLTLYQRIKENPDIDMQPRTVIFGGKAAPGYHMARLIIKLINSAGDIINRDPQVGDRLKIVFLPNFNVKNAQIIYPAADLSEQISMAGMEASGTGNMKFAMNGALTIGTLDGANIEIREEVGAENFFQFGLTTEQVGELRRQGYHPWDYYQGNAMLKMVIDMIGTGLFAHGDHDLFKPITENLLHNDPFLLLADYSSYIDCQDRVATSFADTACWSRMSILNVLRIGKFSSDRAIREYCRDIWQVEPLRVE